MIKLLFLFSSHLLQCSMSLLVIFGGFNSRRFSYSKVLWLKKWQVPSICTLWDTESSMEMLKQKIVHNDFCQQHDHAAVLSLLTDFYFESFQSHIMQVYIFVYIYKVSYIHFFVIFNYNVFFGLHAKHLEIKKYSVKLTSQLLHSPIHRVI